MLRGLRQLHGTLRSPTILRALRVLLALCELRVLRAVPGYPQCFTELHDAPLCSARSEVLWVLHILRELHGTSCASEGSAVLYNALGCSVTICEFTSALHCSRVSGLFWFSSVLQHTLRGFAVLCAQHSALGATPRFQANNTLRCCFGYPAIRRRSAVVHALHGTRRTQQHSAGAAQLQHAQQDFCALRRNLGASSRLNAAFSLVTCSGYFSNSSLSVRAPPPAPPQFP